MNFYYCDIHTHKKREDKNILSVLNIDVTEQSESYENSAFISAGIHPWNAEDVSNNSFLEKLDRLLKDNKRIIAIGEIGIDKICSIDVEAQKRIFLSQLELAKKYSKPVIIHCGRAYDEIISTQKKYSGLPFILHNFQSSLEMAFSLIHRGFYLSFGENLLRCSKLQEVFKNLPISSCFLETDNNNLDIKELYKKAADLKEFKNIEDFAAEIMIRFKIVFRINNIPTHL